MRRIILKISTDVNASRVITAEEYVGAVLEGEDAEETATVGEAEASTLVAAATEGPGTGPASIMDHWRSDLHRIGRRMERDGLMELMDPPGRKLRYEEADAVEEAGALLL